MLLSFVFDCFVLNPLPIIFQKENIAKPI